MAELADYYGVKGKDDNDSRACAKVRLLWSHATVCILCSRVVRQVPLDFWFVEGMPMVLNNNRATHCNWTNGTCGRAVKLIAHKSERPDAGEGEFWDLQHQPIACVFKQDQAAFTLGADAAEPYAWSKDALVLQPVLAKFKWHPLNRDLPLTVWRRNIEASPALCFTNYKVIGATLKSVVIYLPNPAHLKGQKSFSLQHKLVMLSRTRRMKNLFFLCADDYDFDGFLRELKVPEVRAVHILPVRCMN